MISVNIVLTFIMIKIIVIIKKTINIRRYRNS